MNVDQEPLGFRWTRFSLVLSLLMPTWSLVEVPPKLTFWLQHRYNAPLPLFLVYEFGN